MCVHPKTYSKLALQTGLLFGGLYVLCFLWPWMRGLNAELSALHFKMWQIAFFGYTGMNVMSFIVGLVQSFIWGAVAVGVWRLMGWCSGARASHEHSEGGHCADCK